MMADPFKVSGSRAVTIHLTPNDDDQINCSVCRRFNPSWCYTYQLDGCRITAGMCEQCCQVLSETESSSKKKPTDEGGRGGGST